MSCFKYLVMCSVIVAASLKSTNALTDKEKEQIRGTMMPAMSECGPKFEINLDALKNAKEKGELEGINPCFFACMFKKNGFMNDKGEFVPESTLEKTKEVMKSEEDVAKVKDVIEQCASVNDEPVKDGEEGCERALLLFKCFRQHKSKISV